MPLLVPISVGELFDKISILELKAEVIADPARLAHVMRELALLDAVRDRDVAASPELAALYAELAAVNRLLWRIEDDLRRIEQTGRFGDRFIELARSVYRENDRRAALKRQINELTGSEIVEEKSYTSV
jgi:Family of unknown function (DUF6165)